MPTVPIFNQQTPQPQRPNVRLGDFIPTAQGLVGGVQDLGQILEQERLRADQTAVAAADTTRESWANTRLYDPTNGAFTREGANALGVTNEVLGDYDKHITDLVGGLNNRRQQLAFIQNAQGQRMAIQGQLARFESEQRGKYEDQTALSRMSTAIDSAALAYTDPATQAQSRQALETTLADQKSRKGWDDTTFQAQRAAAFSNMHESVITNMLANRQVPLAQTYFNANQSELDAPGRAKVLDRIDATMRSEWADMERMQTLSDKQKKDAANLISKNGDKLLANDQLSASWIEQNRTLMDPNDYRYFYQKLTGAGGEAPRNVALYADLRDRAGRGEDVRDDARSALHEGNIRVSDYDRIIGEVETERPGWYKRGSEYIKSMSGISLLNPSVDAPQRYASMMDQWSDYARAHPDATDAEGQRAYQDLVSHNMIVEIAGLPSPRFMVGDRLSPDIQKTAQATKDAFAKGQLTPQEYKREQELIVRWNNALPKKKAPANP